MGCKVSKQSLLPEYELIENKLQKYDEETNIMSNYMNFLASMKCEELYNLYNENKDKIIKETYIFLISNDTKITESYIKSNFSEYRILKYCKSYDTKKEREGVVFTPIEAYYKSPF